MSENRPAVAHEDVDQTRGHRAVYTNAAQYDMGTRARPSPSDFLPTEAAAWNAHEG